VLLTRGIDVIRTPIKLPTPKAFCEPSISLKVT
jgi:hypothetical protein